MVFLAVFQKSKERKIRVFKLSLSVRGRTFGNLRGICSVRAKRGRTKRGRTQRDPGIPGLERKKRKKNGIPDLGPWIRSGPGKPNQRKVTSWTFHRGFRNRSSMWTVLLFLRKKHQNSQKWVKFMNFAFGPFFGLVCRGDSWLKTRKGEKHGKNGKSGCAQNPRTIERKMNSGIFGCNRNKLRNKVRNCWHEGPETTENGKRNLKKRACAHRTRLVRPRLGGSDFPSAQKRITHQPGNILSCNWNGIFQEDNSQTILPCDSLNHKQIRVMSFSGNYFQ